MKSKEQFTGKDFEALWIANGYKTARGKLDREAVALEMGVCVRAVGKMMKGTITGQTYRMLEIHPALTNRSPLPG